MRYKAIIFDLDGTLTDTLVDLAASTNYALECMGMPQRTLDEVRRFVGNGVGNLIKRAVPEGTREPEVAQCLQYFKQHYIVHCMDNTCLYPGVAEMLETLHGMGLRMAIVSNKLQSGVDELYDTYFRNIVDIAIGEREGIKRKPAPDMVDAALMALGMERSDVIYVGDSEVDIETAANAGLPCISVLWGFKDKEFLLAHGATALASVPDDIVRLVSASDAIA